MNDDLFEQHRKNAKDKELQVRVAAAVASAAATYMVERIEAASEGAGQSFVGVMETYWQHFHFYAGLQDELERRCSARQQMSPYQAAVNDDLHNSEMFGAVAVDLDDPNFEVCTSPLVSVHEKPEVSRRERLHTTLHVVELAAALNHETYPVAHMIGPVVGLVLGWVDRGEQKHARDPFSETSRFLSRLEDIDKQLRKIAVGVHRVPDFWPRLINLEGQRKRRNLPNAAHLPASAPLSVEEAEGAVSLALDKLRQKKLGVLA